jgi:hypothetical protein
MKILRSITRRGFSVGTAGFFSVLKPNTWFPATRLKVPFRYHASQSADLTGVHEAALPPKIMTLNGEHRGLLRPALTLLAAIAITSVALWWMMHP